MNNNYTARDNQSMRNARPRLEMDEFAFQVSAQAGTNAASAEDLFKNGKKIRSSVSEHPPEELHNGSELTRDSHTTLKCPLLSESGSTPKSKGKKSLCSVFTARKKGQTTNPFERREGFNLERQTKWPRERVSASQTITSQSSSGQKSARSLFQDKDSKYLCEKDVPTLSQGGRKLTSSFSNLSLPPPHSSSSSMLALSASSKSNQRWKLKGSKLLHRSASEGQARKDHMRRYMSFNQKQEERKSSSFRSTDNAGNDGYSALKGRGRSVSAHELHYTRNKAVSENQKKKTFLPYKQGILG